MSTFFEHVVEQYPPDIKRQKYEYWRRLSAANADYRQTHSHSNIEDEKQAFYDWMLKKWGIKIGVETQGYSPYFQIVDQNKYLLFQLKYH